MVWYYELIMFFMIVAVAYFINSYIFGNKTIVFIALIGVFTVFVVSFNVLSYYYLNVVVFLLAILIYILFIDRGRQSE